MSISRGERTVLRPGDRNRVQMGLQDWGPGKTQQHYAEEVDIHVIVDRWLKTGHDPRQNLQNPAYGDFSQVPDLHTAINQVKRAEADFMRLPADLRRRFSNSPAEMMAWLEDPANGDEARDLGMLPAVDAEPPEAAPAPEAAASPPEDAT